MADERYVRITLTKRSAEVVERILFNAADCLEEDQEYRVCLRTAAKLRRALGSSRSGDPDWSYIEGKPGPLVPPVRNGKLRLKFPRLKRRE